jgi:hypothetical protein
VTAVAQQLLEESGQEQVRRQVLALGLRHAGHPCGAQPAVLCAVLPVPRRVCCCAACAAGTPGGRQAGRLCVWRLCCARYRRSVRLSIQASNTLLAPGQVACCFPPLLLCAAGASGPRLGGLCVLVHRRRFATPAVQACHSLCSLPAVLFPKHGLGSILPQLVRGAVVPAPLPGPAAYPVVASSLPACCAALRCTSALVCACLFFLGAWQEGGRQ